MHARQETVFSVAALVAAALLAATVGVMTREDAIQAGSGDLLSIFFHDARAVLGKSLVTRADSYYHGGVTLGMGVTCPDHDAHDASHDHAHDAVHPHPETGSNAVEEGAEATDSDEPQRMDPWVWINDRVHVQEHRHLQGKEIEEVLPWIWAACRASPNNTEAYGMGWYVLAKMRRKVDAGLMVLEEGIRNNPDDLDLAFTLGQSLYSDKHDPAAAEAAFHAVREKALRKSDGDLTRLSEDDGRFLANALNYLAVMARERGDREAIRAYLEQAETAAPNYISTRSIRKTLEALQE